MLESREMVSRPLNPEKSIYMERGSEDNGKIAAVLGEPQYFVISTEVDNYHKNVTKMLLLMKRSYALYSSLDELPETPPENLVGLVLCEGNLDNIGNIDTLFNYAAAGKEAIFTKRLETTASNYRLYSDRFGIVKSGDSYSHTGIDFLNKILISGLFFNANLTTTVNEVTLSGKCQVFAVCADPDAPPYEDKNPVIWRTYWSGGAMYFFNNDLMDDFYSVGLFAGIMSMDKDVFIYPIINTNIVTLNGLPYLSTANDENLLETYSRDTAQFQADTIWTDLLSITKQFDLKYTLYPVVGEGQESVEAELLQNIGKMVAVNNFEVGIYPSSKFSEIFPNYKRTTSNQYTTEETRSRIVNDIRNFSYTASGSVTMPIVSKTVSGKRAMTEPGKEPDNLNRFRTFSFASGLGYISHECDFLTVFEDKNGEDLWSGYKLNFIEEYYPVVTTYDYIEINNVSEAAEKLRIFLDMVPDIKVYENEIIIRGQEVGSTCYIMRTARKIIETENCTVTNLKDDFYLVEMSRADAIIYTQSHI